MRKNETTRNETKRRAYNRERLVEEDEWNPSSNRGCASALACALSLFSTFHQKKNNFAHELEQTEIRNIYKEHHTERDSIKSGSQVIQDFT